MINILSPIKLCHTQKIFYIFWAITLINCHQSLQAQILNVEKFRLRADTANVIVGNFGLGFSSKNQKNNVLNFSTEGDLVYLSKKHSYKLISELSLVKVDEEEAISEGYAHLRFNFFRKSTFSLEQFGQIQYDVGRGLTQRALVGAVMRYSAVSNEKYELSFNTGPMYEWEIWEGETPSEELENQFWKISTNMLFRASFSEHLGLVMITYYQARPQSIAKPRITTDSQLIFRLNKRFSVGINYTATYDAAPVIDIAEYISELSTSININF